MHVTNYSCVKMAACIVERVVHIQTKYDACLSIVKLLCGYCESENV